MNEFSQIAEHENKRIDSVSITSSGVKIKWAIVTPDGEGDSNVTTGSVSNPEPAHQDFIDWLVELGPWVRDYYINKVDSAVTDDWDNRVRVLGITFKHNTKGITAQVSAIFRGLDEQHGDLKTPATPLFKKGEEGHESGATVTFGEGNTDILNNVMHEARLYLGGKRGSMQQKLDEDI